MPKKSSCGPVELPFSRGFRHTGLAAAAMMFVFVTVPTLDPTAALADDQISQRWALLIGVNDYANIKNLRFCGDDIQGLRDKLVASGFAADHVFHLHSGAEEARYQPFKANIERQLELVLGLAAENDIVLVAFSGHGVHIDGQSYLCSSEAKLDAPKETMVSLNVVYDRLKRSQATFKLLLVDACRNDPTLEGQKSVLTPRETGLGADVRKPPEGILSLSSCAEGQVSMEDKKLGHGVFMNFVLEGLGGAADEAEYGNQDGKVSLPELFEYANSKTGTYVAKHFNDLQTPLLRGEFASPFSRFVIATTIAPRERNLTNSLGMKLVLIPEGEFEMGSRESKEELLKRFPTAKPEWLTGEWPVHRVRISRPFYMGTYEISKGEFAQFVDATGYRTDAEKDDKGGWGWNGTKKEFSQDKVYTWRSWGVKQSDNSPVVNVSWNDATAFCEWLSRKEGKTYRLPTEAEWEYACRAGSATLFHFGDDPEGLARYGNVLDGTAKEQFNTLEWNIRAKDGWAFTSPRGTYLPNAFGLYDMHGNAFEWCSDWYGEDYYANSPADDPQGPPAGSFRVIRGGAWDYRPVDCRSSYRSNGGPAYRYLLHRFSCGLRAVGSGRVVLINSDLCSLNSEGVQGASAPWTRKMMKPAETPLFVKTHDFLLWLIRHTQRFPKNLRHSYTLHLENRMLEFQEAILMGNAVRGSQRGLWLAQADGKLVSVRALLRVAHDLELLASTQVRYACEQVDELGRLLGAWRKGTDRRPPAPSA